MYKNPDRFAMPFQNYVTSTMLKLHIKQTEKPIKLMERSMFSARYCFVEKMLSNGMLLEGMYHVLQEWYEFIHQHHKVHCDLISLSSNEPWSCIRTDKKACTWRRKLRSFRIHQRLAWTPRELAYSRTILPTSSGEISNKISIWLWLTIYDCRFWFSTLIWTWTTSTRNIAGRRTAFLSR